MSTSLFAQHTYYISKSAGSDSNTSTQAQSKSTPWAHLPGMPSCTANCASYTPVAGDSFILKGGDTWVASDLDLYWQWTGTSSAPIYIGVDQTWYNSGSCGSSWCRPVFTCGGGSCSYTDNGHGFYTDQGGIQYVTVDNIEFTGLYQSTAGYPNYFSVYGSYNTFEHNYIHGWSHASAASGALDQSVVFSSGTCCGGGIGNIFHDNVIDGADTENGGDSMYCFTNGIDNVYNNICRNVSNGFVGSGTNIHDNWFGPINPCFPGGCHQNALFQFGPNGSATSVFIYNNVISGVPSGGMVKLWLSGNAPTTATGYAFNNVLYGNAQGNDVNLGGHSAVNYGTWYLFNNSIECGTDASPGTGAGACANDSGGTSGETFVLHSRNNHWIKGDTTAPVTCTYGTCDFTTDVTQTVTTANGQGYTSTETYAFAPTSASGSTVGGGTNERSICTTIAGLNAAAGTACQSDTGYACSYNTSNHTVSCPDRIEIAKPTSAAWDVGAYEFAPAGCSITPTNIGPYTAGQLVSQQFTASNCNTSTFTISSGSLSGSGLTLSSGGLLSGTAQAGSFSFTATYGIATDTVSLTINAAPSITTSTLPAGQANVSYSQVLTTSGGTGTVACAVTSGSLPAGLSLSGCTISGTPTTANTYSFSVTPSDANSVSGSAQALSILINPATGNTSTPLILHTTFCGPAASWPGTCTLSAATTAGSRLVVVYSSYNSAGSTPVMNSVTDSGGDTFLELANARSTNTSSASSWNDIWSASGVSAGQTALTITPSTTQTGDVYVWEVQNAANVVGCAPLSSQPAASTAVGAPMPSEANAIVLAHLHPAPGGYPTAVSSPFTTDLITDQMGYSHYTTSSSGIYEPQWTQTAETFATATCAFSASATQPNPATSFTAIVH